jgi:hypothetical protein
MDAETFGHHVQNWENLFLADVYQRINDDTSHVNDSDTLVKETTEMIEAKEEHDHEIKVVNISQLLSLFKRGYQVEPKTSSWSTTAMDIEFQNPFPLWNDPGNQLHKLLWEHLNLAIEMVEKAQSIAGGKSKAFAEISRAMLDPALHSCQFWWASQRPMWDINMVHRGIQEQQEALLNAYRAIVSSDCDELLKRECHYKFLAAQEIQDKIVEHLVSDNL